MTNWDKQVEVARSEIESAFRIADEMADAIDDLTRRHEHALHKIDVLEDRFAKAMRALVAVDRWLKELDMYADPDYHLAPSLQMVRDTVLELKGASDG